MKFPQDIEFCNIQRDSYLALVHLVPEHLDGVPHEQAPILNQFCFLLSHDYYK